VGISTAINWVQRFHETGSVKPDQIGGYRSYYDPAHPARPILLLARPCGLCCRPKKCGRVFVTLILIVR
jgi:hypothetical protein